MDSSTRRSKSITKIVIRIIICIVALALLYACYIGIESHHIKTAEDYSKTLICVKSEEGTLENAENETVTYYGIGVKVRWYSYKRYDENDEYIGDGTFREFYVFGHLWWEKHTPNVWPDWDAVEGSD